MKESKENANSKTVSGGAAYLASLRTPNNSARESRFTVQIEDVEPSRVVAKESPNALATN